MKISKTTEHFITFSVQYFQAEEGGMSNEQFGDDVDTLEEAIELLMTARATNKRKTGADWVIVCEVDTKIKGKDDSDQVVIISKRDAKFLYNAGREVYVSITDGYY